MLSLTDMWRAAGSVDSKRPAYWLRHDGTTEFIEHIVGNVIPDHIEVVQQARGGSDPGENVVELPKGDETATRCQSGQIGHES